ncbi:FMN-binding protein [Dehalobacter sp. DCM]|uniref:FMN-binding protein n=1 Tax=Dehalobacter sp. DCM TaxID=2907827 RepID=UPI0030816B6C|nr:FMN-binding protein [Dehalobacter sp. DCM]
MKRGNIIKKIVIFSMCFVLIFAIAGCGSKTNTYKPGSYTASGQGKNGPVKVQVTFSEKEITAIEILEHSETPSLGADALPLIVEDIKANQSLAVDAVTGATYSSNAVLAAVEDCVKQAGGDPELLKSEK